MEGDSGHSKSKKQLWVVAFVFINLNFFSEFRLLICWLFLGILTFFTILTFFSQFRFFFYFVYLFIYFLPILTLNSEFSLFYILHTFFSLRILTKLKILNLFFLGILTFFPIHTFFSPPLTSDLAQNWAFFHQNSDFVSYNSDPSQSLLSFFFLYAIHTFSSEFWLLSLNSEVKMRIKILEKFFFKIYFCFTILLLRCGPNAPPY